MSTSRCASVIAAALLLGAAVAGGAETSPMRVFIASDSTAQDYAPDKYPQQGWGTLLRCAFGPEVVVENRAIAARSTRTFIEEGRLAEIARDIRAGDTLLIQFGHNDANRQKPERYASVPEYKAYLRRFIDTATSAGAQPVLITPVTLRNFAGATVAPNFFADYSAAVLEVAQATGTPAIDLAALSRRWVETAGPEISKRFYLDDDVHFRELGARGVANLVATALAGLDVPIAKHVLAQRPALTLTAATGGASCVLPPTMPAQRYRFTGRALPGEVQVDTGHAYDGRFGFEPTPSRQFSLALPEGSWRVTMTLGNAKAATRTTLKAESRRLMLQDIATKAGQFVTRSFVLNTRTAQLTPPPLNAPGGSAVRLNEREAGSYTWDDKLTLEFLGDAPGVAALSVEPAQVPTVFLLGDSTVTDQRRGGASWGQMLPVYFGTDVAIANYAESGETLKSFLAELRLDKLLAAMRPGDFALLQFAHNDQKFQWPQTYVAASSTYRAYLRAYIAEIRLRGATPLLVTPPERRVFTAAGKIRSTLADYAEATRVVAAEEHIALIDLNAASVRFYEALGPTRAPLAFAAEGRDATHHNNYGAFVLARAVVEGIRSADSPLAKLLAPDLAPFDAGHPIPPEDFRLADTPSRGAGM